MRKCNYIFLAFYFTVFCPILSFSNEKLTVSSPELNVRNGPGHKFNIIDKIIQGTSVIELEYEEIEPGVTWVRINYGNGVGWVNKKYLTITTAPQNYDSIRSNEASKINNNLADERIKIERNNESLDDKLSSGILYFLIFFILVGTILILIMFFKKRSREILVDIRSTVIQVSGSLYSVDKISAIKSVTIKPNFFELISGRRRYALLMKANEDYFLLVGSWSSKKIDEIFYKIRDAIDAKAKGNFTYVSEVKLNGDIINQKGNFAVGFSSGQVNMSDVINK